MRIPWKKLAKDPIVVDIDEIYIVVGPHFGELIIMHGWSEDVSPLHIGRFPPSDRPYDPEWDRKRKLRAKEEQIKKYKKAAKQLKESKSYWQ